MKSLMTRWKLDPLYPNPFSPAKRKPCYVSLLGKAILKMEKIERQEGRPVIPQTSAKSTEVLCCLGNIIPIQADDNPPNILPHRVPDAYVKVHLVCDFGLDFCFLERVEEPNQNHEISPIHPIAPYKLRWHRYT